MYQGRILLTQITLQLLEAQEIGILEKTDLEGKWGVDPIGVKVAGRPFWRLL